MYMEGIAIWSLMPVKMLAECATFIRFADEVKSGNSDSGIRKYR